MKSSANFKTNLLKKLALDVVVLAFLAVGLLVATVSLYHTFIYAVAFALPKLFTLFLPAVTLCLGLGVRCLTNPVHALLCLIAVFFNTVILYLAAEAEFLALVFLIVYVGAIAILFLFVIRLLNVKELSAAPRQVASPGRRLLLTALLPLALSFRYLRSESLGSFLIESELLTNCGTNAGVTSLEQFTS